MNWPWEGEITLYWAQHNHKSPYKWKGEVEESAWGLGPTLEYREGCELRGAATSRGRPRKERETVPRSLQKEKQSRSHLDFFSFPAQLDPSQTSDPQNCEVVHLCCFSHSVFCGIGKKPVQYRRDDYKARQRREDHIGQIGVLFIRNPEVPSAEFCFLLVKQN